MDSPSRVEPVQTLMRICVVDVRLPNPTFQSMHGKVHPTEPICVHNEFGAKNADLTVPIFLVVTDKLSTLDEHTARAARWVENRP